MNTLQQHKSSGGQALVEILLMLSLLLPLFWGMISFEKAAKTKADLQQHGFLLATSPERSNLIPPWKQTSWSNLLLLGLHETTITYEQSLRLTFIEPADQHMTSLYAYLAATSWSKQLDRLGNLFQFLIGF